MEKLETPNILSFSMYMDMMNLLKYEAEVEEKNSESRPRASVACEFESSFDFKESFTRHKRMKENMNTKQLQPLTASQGKKELNQIVICMWSIDQKKCCFSAIWFSFDQHPMDHTHYYYHYKF